MDKVKFALFTIQRLENDYLDEFICYHLNLGFERIYIYDDSREDEESVEKIVAKYGEKVFYYKWNGTLTEAHSHFNENFSDQMEWLLVIDVDQFLYLKKHENIKSFVHEHPEKKGYFLLERNFGNSGHIEDPKGLVMDNYVWCSKDLSTQGKSLIKIDEVPKSKLGGCCHIKALGYLWEGDRLINSLTACDKYSNIDEVDAYINHYYQRSREYMINKKLRRGCGGIIDKKINYAEVYQENVKRLALENFDKINFILDTSLREKYSLKTKKMMQTYGLDLGLHPLGNLEELEKSYYYDPVIVKKFHKEESLEKLFLDNKLIYSKAQEILLNGMYERWYRKHMDMEWILNTHKLYKGLNFITVPENFDWKVYSFLNEDLKITSREDALKYFTNIIHQDRPSDFNLPIDFNWQEYISLHRDLLHLNELEAKKHYSFTGCREGRKYKYDLPKDFNWEEYISLNSDLSGKEEWEVKKHYFYTGCNENRRYKK